HIDDIILGDGGVLRIRHASEVLGALICERPTSYRSASRTGATAIRQVIHESEDDRVVTVAIAALDSSRPGKREVNAERACAAVRHHRVDTRDGRKHRR